MNKTLFSLIIFLAVLPNYRIMADNFDDPTIEIIMYEEDDEGDGDDSDKESSDDELDHAKKGKRTAPIPCHVTISKTEGIIIAGESISDIISLELYDYNDFLIASFTNHVDLIDFLCDTSGIYRILIKLPDKSLSGIIEIDLHK